MAGLAPAPLPSLSGVLEPLVNNYIGAPAPLPSLSLVFDSPRGSLTASAGSFTLTGKAAALDVGHKLASAAGAYTYTLTGQAATLSKDAIAQGGDPAPLPSLGLVLGPTTGVTFMPASTGAFVISSQSATLVQGRGLIAASGAFVLSGAPALRDLQVTADKATYALTGTAATLSRVSPGLTATTGAFAVTGYAAALTYETPTAKTLAAFPGAFALTGVDVVFPTTIARQLIADKGTFALTGHSASMTFLGWAPQGPPLSTWTNVAPSSTTWNNA